MSTKREALAGQPLEKRKPVRFRSLESSPVPSPPDGEDHRDPCAGGQSRRRGHFRVQQVIHAQLREVHPAPPGLEMTEIGLERLFGEDEADLPALAQKSLLYT